MEAGGSEDERKLVGGWVGVGEGGVQVDLQGNSIYCHIGAFLVSVQTCIFILVPNQPPRIFPNFRQLNLSNITT